MRELEREVPALSPDPSADRGGVGSALAIVGNGRAGGSLAAAARQAGIETTVAGRDELAAVARDAAVVLLCVPDAAVSEAAVSVCESATRLKLLGHVSGSLGLDTISGALPRGARAFAIHPLQTLPDSASAIAGCGCAVSGSSPEALEFASTLAERLGMRPFRFDDTQRAAYHAAASIASNFLVTLEESATALLTRAGVADARELLAPLVLRSAVNWADRGAEALTGPIARGDAATVERHLEAISTEAPELAELYRALAERTRAIAPNRAGDPA